MDRWDGWAARGRQEGNGAVRRWRCEGSEDGGEWGVGAGGGGLGRGGGGVGRDFYTNYWILDPQELLEQDKEE